MPTAPKTHRPPHAARRHRAPWQRTGLDKRKDFRGRNRQDAKHRILERDDFTCQQCGRLVVAGNSHLDHITPLCRGGTHEDENLQTLCIGCSKTKTAKEAGGCRYSVY